MTYINPRLKHVKKIKDMASEIEVYNWKLVANLIIDQCNLLLETKKKTKWYGRIRAIGGEWKPLETKKAKKRKCKCGKPVHNLNCIYCEKHHVEKQQQDPKEESKNCLHSDINLFFDTSGSLLARFCKICKEKLELVPTERKELSNCCNSTFHSDMADEGTSCYVCNHCGKACDVSTIEHKLEVLRKATPTPRRSEEPKEEMKEIEKLDRKPWSLGNIELYDLAEALTNHGYKIQEIIERVNILSKIK